MTAPKAARRCVCKGVIEADPETPGPAVLEHNRTVQHVAWRMGYRVSEFEGTGMLTPDGLPVTRLERVA